MPYVAALCVSESKGERKRPIESAVFCADHGIEGDAHAGPWHRQVSILSSEDIELVKRQLPDIAPGDFAENIILTGIDLGAVGVGTRLRLGSDVIVSITQIGKECHTPCRIYKLTGDCLMPRAGLFAQVEAGGKVCVGDPAEIIELLPRTGR